MTETLTFEKEKTEKIGNVLDFLCFLWYNASNCESFDKGFALESKKE